MPDTISKLLVHWASAGAEPVGGATEEEIQAFQKTYNVRMPDDLHNYFLKINGMRRDWRCDQDGNGFSFWPLAALGKIDTSDWPRSGSEEEFPQLFIFADYLSSSWQYAIGLWSRGKEGNPVFLIDGRSSVVAGSFSEFLELYLIDSPQLYPVNETSSPPGDIV